MLYIWPAGNDITSGNQAVQTDRETKKKKETNIAQNQGLLQMPSKSTPDSVRLVSSRTWEHPLPSHTWHSGTRSSSRGVGSIVGREMGSIPLDLEVCRRKDSLEIDLKGLWTHMLVVLAVSLKSNPQKNAPQKHALISEGRAMASQLERHSYWNMSHFPSYLWLRPAADRLRKRSACEA